MKFADFQDNWAGGVVTNARPEKLPPNAYPSAPNMQLRDLGSGTAILGTRPGLIMQNSAKISAHTILGQIDLRQHSGGELAGQHMVVTAAGKLKIMSPGGTVADADAGVPTPFTAGEYYPDFAVASNMLFIVNGQENKKYNGTNIQNVGGNSGILTALWGPPLPGAAGNPDGTYDFLMTAYDSSTGYETSTQEGYQSVTVTTDKITFSVPAALPGDTYAQFDSVRVYIRKGTLSGSFFRLVAGVSPSPDATTGAFALGTGALTIDITDSQFNALTELAPNSTENDGPPVLDRISFHQNRLFGVRPDDPSVLLFSKLTAESVEAWDPNNLIAVSDGDGERITAIESSSETRLLIFKTSSIYALVGTYPDWELEIVSAHTGATGHQSLLTYDKQTYFWSLQGPAVTNGSEVTLLGQPHLSNKLDELYLEFSLLNHVVIGLDKGAQRLLWALPQVGKTRNNILMPFNLHLGVFESEKWELIDVASMALVYDTDEIPRLHIGDYKGRIFRMDSLTFNDGVASGTKQGSPTSATSSTLTDSGAAFFTTDDGLAQLYVIVKNESGAITQRKRIGSNTGTVLTLDSGETFDPVPDTTYTYYIAAADVTFNFGWKDGEGTPFVKKRLDYILADLVPPQGETDLSFRVYLDTGSASSLDFETTAVGSLWDQGLWDQSLWSGSLAVQHIRQRIGAVGRVYLVDMNTAQPDVSVAVVRFGVTSRHLTEKT